MQHGQAHVQQGFDRPVPSGLLICSNLLYEHHIAHCYICYILRVNQLPNSA